MLNQLQEMAPGECRRERNSSRSRGEKSGLSASRQETALLTIRDQLDRLGEEFALLLVVFSGEVEWSEEALAGVFNLMERMENRRDLLACSLDAVLEGSLADGPQPASGASEERRDWCEG